MILITRPKTEAKQFACELNKRSIVSVIDSVIKFEPQRKNIYLTQNKIFIITSSQSVKSLNRYRKLYFHLIDAFLEPAVHFFQKHHQALFF